MNAKCYLTFFDTATILIEIGGLRFLTDPVLDAAGSDYHHGPVHLHKTSKPGFSVQALGRLDAILLSHDQHADNLDEGGRNLLPHAGRVLTTEEGATRLGGNTTGLAPWQSVEIADGHGLNVRATAMPAQHGPEGTQDATGPVTGFLLEWPGQTHGGLYLSGDTVLYEGTREIAERARVGVAVLNIGRVQLAPMGELTFSLSAAEAASYGQALGAATIIPVHFEGWAHFTEGRDAAANVFAASPVKDRVVWLTPGVRTAIDI